MARLRNLCWFVAASALAASELRAQAIPPRSELPVEFGNPRLSPSERPFLFPNSHPALAVNSTAASDAVDALNRDLQSGKKTLKFEPNSGYLNSVLELLEIFPESQSVVFSQTSLQKRFISPKTPRAIYFNDNVSVGFIPGAPLLEIAAISANGVAFYAIEQRADASPRFARHDECLQCHISANSLSVPGLLLRSVATDASGKLMPWLENTAPDHRTRFTERWAGWYVTGRAGRERHMGNLRTEPSATEAPLNNAGSLLPTLIQEFDTAPYPLHSSDVAALLVMNHQVHMTNLILRAGIEAKLLDGQVSPEYQKELLASNARAVADYMLFVNEVSIEGDIQTSSKFAEKFAALGPFDKKGRSLRQLRLSERLMQFPCSYMVYSKAFRDMPRSAREAIYGRLWSILSGAEKESKYDKLSEADRRAIIEILRDTKDDLPTYFK